MSKRKKYRVMATIRHSGDGKTYEPGAEVSLDHLDDAAIEKLLLRGAVVPVSGVEKKVAKRSPTARIVEEEDGSNK